MTVATGEIKVFLMKKTTAKATTMVVNFSHMSDTRAYAESLRGCNVPMTVRGRDVVVRLSTPESNEIARNIVPSNARVFWE